MHTLATLTAYLRDVVNPTAVKTFNDMTPISNLIPEEPYNQDRQISWNVKSANGALAALVPEGGAVGAVTQGTIRRAVTTFGTYQKPHEVSGESISTGAWWKPGGAMDEAVDEVITGTALAVEAFLAGRLVTDLAAGGNIYGLVRAANNLVTDIQPGGGVAVTEAGLAASYQALLTGFREAPIDDVMILSTPGQRGTYTDLAGIGAAAAVPVQFRLATGDTGFDLGRLSGAVSYNGRPWMTATSVLNTSIYFLHMNLARKIIKKSFEIIPLARNGYPVGIMGVIEIGFKYADPGKASAITGLLAA